MPRTDLNSKPLSLQAVWLAALVAVLCLGGSAIAERWSLFGGRTMPVNYETVNSPQIPEQQFVEPSETAFGEPLPQSVHQASSGPIVDHSHVTGMYMAAPPGLSPAAPYPISGVDCNGPCAGGCGSGELGWGAMRPLDWQPYAQGEYVGHARQAHVGEYRLRVDDQLEFVFRLTREETSHPYQLNVGDEIRVESFTDPLLNRDLLIQPDGTITLRLVGQVKATRQTVVQLREQIETLYEKYYKIPSITVTPLKVNTKLEDLRATVDARAGAGGQNRQAKVTPEGTIALPAVGNVPVQGLTLGELKRELDQRYAAEVEGIEVTPVLLQRAPRYVYVLGEVRTPGRFVLDGPTTVMQSIAMAGGWNVGANTRQIVVFRRGDDWRLMATMLDLRGALYGKTPCPADELWINDADVVVVPKSPILVADDFINLVFTRGLYGVAPFSVGTNFSFLNTLSSVP
ncbi:MAG: polysaccharide biosynthesis/export family protein [Planctomycetaceae bacterium]|nr:polysaccharide biosynthesis/export family protein [Planctomycetaceae bacterium]